MLKINATNHPSIANYILSYKVYIDYLNSCSGEKTDYLFSNDPDGISVLHIFDNEIVEKARKDSRNAIFINNSHENANTHYILKKLPTDKFYIILSTGKWDPTYYNLPISYINLTRYMYFYEYISFAFNQQHIMFHNGNKYDFDYPKQYNFVSTTGNTKPERDKFIDYMLQNLKTDNFIFRYSGVDLGKSARKIDIIDIEPNNFDGYRHIQGFENYYYTVSYSLPIDMYNNAYFNLVLEGDIDWPHQFLPSEKIVKTLLTGMPFVLVGSPLFLDELKKLGFRTYNELWDESYDSEFDYNKRIEKIIDLCNLLLKFDWVKHRDKLMEIGQHNRDYFLQLKNLFLQEYQQTSIQLEQLKQKQVGI